jgi:hypothetical protein
MITESLGLLASAARESINLKTHYVRLFQGVPLIEPLSSSIKI